MTPPPSEPPQPPGQMLQRGTSLDGALSAALAGVAETAKARGIAVFQSGIEDQSVQIPGRRLIKVLTALLSSAIRRAPEDDGVVILTTRNGARPGTVALTIRDNGDQFSEADLPVTLRRLVEEDDGQLWTAPDPAGGTRVMLMMRRE